jgi:hypothetical protein
MEDSILTTIKKLLGLDEGYTVFDLDVITHINTAFSTLTQLGVGPSSGFMIQDETAVWSDYVMDDWEYNQIKTYIYLRTKQYFDPPTTRYTISSIDNMINEFAWRINVHREETGWVDPNPPDPVPPDYPWWPWWPGARQAVEMNDGSR